MASDFIADSAERLILAMRALGISAEVAGMVAAEWGAGVEADWGGERPYIGKGAAAQRATSQRDAALLRDWAAGERTQALARRYGISTRRVRKIIELASGGGTALP